MQTPHRLFSAAVLAMASMSSFAATTVYTVPASFAAALLPGAYTESFNAVTNPPPASFSGGAFTYSVSAPGGTYASGTFLGTNLPDEALTITFTSGNVRGVGGNFYATNISDAFQTVAVTFTLNDGTTASFTPASAASSFRGFVSTTLITSMVISSPGVSLYAGIDSLTVGAVPEPGSVGLMCLGLAGLAAAARRRKA